MPLFYHYLLTGPSVLRLPMLYSMSIERSTLSRIPSQFTSAFRRDCLLLMGFDELLSKYLASIVASARSTAPLRSMSPRSVALRGSAVVVAAVVVTGAVEEAFVVTVVALVAAVVAFVVAVVAFVVAVVAFVAAVVAFVAAVVAFVAADVVA